MANMFGKRRLGRPPLRFHMHPRVKETLVYGLLIMVCGVWQATPHSFLNLFGGRPLLSVPLVVAIAMFAGPVGGGIAGAFSGILWGVYATAPFGFHALTLLVIGCVAGVLVRQFLHKNALSALVLSAGAAAVQGLADWVVGSLFRYRGEAVLLLWRAVLPNLVYTVLLALPIYAVVYGTTKKMRQKTTVFGNPTKTYPYAEML